MRNGAATKDLIKLYPSCWKALVVKVVGVAAVLLGSRDSLPSLFRHASTFTYDFIDLLTDRAVKDSVCTVMLGFHSVVARDDMYYAVFAGQSGDDFEIHIAKSSDSELWEDAELIRYAHPVDKNESSITIEVIWDDTDPTVDKVHVVWGEEKSKLHMFGSFDQFGLWNGSHSEMVVKRAKKKSESHIGRKLHNTPL